MLAPRRRRIFSFPNAQRYANRIVGLGPTAYWPMSEGGGAVSLDASGNGRNGVYTGVTLGVDGIGDGRTAAAFDGATSYNNVLNAAAAFSGPAGSIGIWMKVNSAGVWSDGVLRRLFHLTVDASNQVSIFKSTANNRVDMVYLAGGVTKTIITTGLSSIGYLHFMLTWNKTADQVIAYVGGAQSGAIATGLGVWAGVPTLMIVGAGALAPSNVISGAEAHAAIFARALPASEVASIGAL